MWEGSKIETHTLKLNHFECSHCVCLDVRVNTGLPLQQDACGGQRELWGGACLLPPCETED